MTSYKIELNNVGLFEGSPVDSGVVDKKVVEEFIDRFKNLENEMAEIKESQKELIAEFKEKIDMKTMKKAMSFVKLKKTVDRKETFDEMVEILEEKECI